LAIEALTTKKLMMMKRSEPKKVVIKNFLLWLLITTKCMMIEMSPILIAFIFTLGSPI